MLAVVTGAHGVGGEVRLKVYADDLSGYASFNDGTLTPLSIRAANGGAIARFAEVADRDAAEASRGVVLTVPRDALPALGEGEYYHADLLALSVTTPDGALVGSVVEVENFGAGDVIEIERLDGSRFMVPLRFDAVPGWDAERLILSPDYLP